MKNIFKYSLLLTAFMTVMLTSCEQEEVLPEAERLFRPIVGSSTISGTWFSIRWDDYTDAAYYELELSTDTFQTIIQTVATDSAQYTFSNLEYDMSYQIRIRAIGSEVLSTGDTIKSNYNLYEVSTTDYPTQLKTPTSADVIDKSIRVAWNVTGMQYSRIDLMVTRDSLFKSVTLTDADNLKGEKIVSGLKPEQTYLAMIYVGDEYKGKKTFKTSASQLFEGAVIDLRDSMDVADPYASFTNAVNKLNPDSFPDGLTIVLAGGMKYEMQTPMITADLHVVTGLSLQGNAIFEVSGNFDAPAQAAGVNPSMTLEKITFTDHPSKPKTSSNFGGTYLFNFSSTSNLNEVTIKDCDIRYKRGVFRIKAATVINKVTLDNCVVDSIGGYGILNLDNGGAMMTDIVIKNSTFSNFYGYLLRDANKTLTSPNSLTIQNVTTYYGPVATRYLIEVTGMDFPGGIVIKNNIFGSGQGDPAATVVNGLRHNSTNVTQEGNYKTNDLVWFVADGATVPAYPIEAEDLGKSSAEIFANPAALDFKVTDSKLVNKAGDPRWW